MVKKLDMRITGSSNFNSEKDSAVKFTYYRVPEALSVCHFFLAYAIEEGKKYIALSKPKQSD